MASYNSYILLIGKYGLSLFVFRNNPSFGDENKKFLPCCNLARTLHQFPDTRDCPCDFRQQVETINQFEYEENEVKNLGNCKGEECRYRVCFKSKLNKTHSNSGNNKTHYQQQCCYEISSVEYPTADSFSSWSKNSMHVDLNYFKSILFRSYFSDLTKFFTNS